jgi:hypothetical protein
LVEGNYAEGMVVPIHNHMSAAISVRNNTLVNEKGDMRISFERSVGCAFTGNRIFCGGKLETVWLDGVPDWKDNIVFNGRSAPFEWNPPRVPQSRRSPVEAIGAVKRPVIDGKFSEGEWNGDFVHIDRLADGSQSGFSSALSRRICWRTSMPLQKHFCLLGIASFIIQITQSSWIWTGRRTFPAWIALPFLCPSGF